MDSKKPLLIIRRSGFYVNAIPNIAAARLKWMENNLTRTDTDGKVLKDGSRSERPVLVSMRVCCVSFTPATAAEVEEAPLYVPALAKQFGVVGKERI